MVVSAQPVLFAVKQMDLILVVFVYLMHNLVLFILHLYLFEQVLVEMVQVELKFSLAAR